MNGIKLYRHLEAEHTELISAVIFTTGDLLSNDAQQFSNEVNRPFLPKPFTPHELIAVVTETLKQTDIKLPLKQTLVI
jgi:CheY-like chemotaxis protein